MSQSDAGDDDLAEIQDRLATVTDGARCDLAQQHQNVVGSILSLFSGTMREHVAGQRDAVEPVLIAPIADLADGVATLDETQASKQPDWSHDADWNGQVPAERFATPPPAG